MITFIYPLIGFGCGFVGGWFTSNVLPGLLVAGAFAAVWFVAAHYGSPIQTIHFAMAVLGITLAALMSFFGAVMGVRIRAATRGK
ncbi:hypothetical protein [Croceicoccus gelatinilyticus]|uniref:hypothetical protein n=1 Tax=Croceicoccus gelatinilyticus TaxID=2835536 RepID=UPI001BCDEC8E|nr:hypothetical protein [Croceicoccus gelatinilyticus]MBS7669429.1 hypothetical protein [Croceicoccus gelatinilyticus]